MQTFKIIKEREMKGTQTLKFRDLVPTILTSVEGNILLFEVYE